MLISESILKILNKTLLLQNLSENELKTKNISFFSLANTIVKKWKSLLKIIFSLNNYPLIWIFISVYIMIFWHIQDLFNLAVLDNFTHILQHLSFIIVGASSFMAIRNFGESFNLILLISLIGVMGMGGVLFSVIEDNIYSVYNIEQHHEAGFYMVLTSFFILVLILPFYLIKKAMVHIKYSNQKSNYLRMGYNLFNKYSNICIIVSSSFTFLACI
ncbi:MAG: hypothetical protein MRJ93_03465 [Nitrososphaeraceae archaeon]|nr:hypothetical protein [Nitrososphaeraceae archaeon]